MSDEFMSALERMKNKAAEEKKLNDFLEKNEKQFIESLNAIASTDHGQFVLRVILNKCWVFIPDGEATPAQRYERSILRDLYLSIRKYLDKDLRQKVEE